MLCLPPLFLSWREEFGVSYATLGLSVALMSATTAVLQTPVGFWVDRHGARLLMTLGSAAGVVLGLLWSTVESLAAFYLIQAAIGLVMAAVFYEVAFTVVAVVEAVTWAGLLIGLGGFNLYDGIVQHKILRLHQVREGVDNLLPYDLAFNALALAALTAGWVLWTKARENP